MFSCHRQQGFNLQEQHFAQSLFLLTADWANQQLSLQYMQLHLLKGKMLNAVVEQLTEAEWQILMLLIQGYDGSEIARLRDKSKETVRSQIKSLLRKTGSRNQHQLIAHYFTRPYMFQR